MPSRSRPFPLAAMIFEASLPSLSSSPSPPTQAHPRPALLNSAHSSGLISGVPFSGKPPLHTPPPLTAKSGRPDHFLPGRPVLTSLLTLNSFYYNCLFHLPSSPSFPTPFVVSSVNLKNRFVFLFIIMFQFSCQAYFRHSINVC